MGVWHFVSVPKKESAEIKETFGYPRHGWGSIPVRVTLGKSSWRTSIFPDKKTAQYVLPLKSEVRKKENVAADDDIKFSIEVLLN